MKKLILLPTLLLLSCKGSGIEYKQTDVYLGHTIPLQVIKLDGCEYYYGDWDKETILTHKGNCKNHKKD